MRYIRTKDGRIIKVAISKEEYERDYKNSNVSYEEWLGCFCFSLDIVKQADTIEELCDRCLVITKYHKEPIYGTFYELEDYIDGWKRKIPSNNPVVAIYGAIWTEWGLKYVAHMNEKGDWELL